MEKKFNFVYITTNLINGKQYIGDHSTDNIDDGYLGSGHLLKYAIRKYGKQNFKREILESTDTKEKAFNLQKKYINEYNTLKPVGYNVSPTGGLKVQGCHSEETIKIISQKVKKTLTGRPLKESTKKLLSEIMLNKKIKRSDEFKQKISIKNKGKKHSEQSRKNISEGHKGLEMPKRYKYILISPKNETHIFIGEKYLYEFVQKNNLSIRLIKSWFNKGKIKIFRRSSLTINTEDWEIKREKL